MTSPIRIESGWLQSLMDASSARHRAVATNIAHLDVNGYRPLRVAFEEELRQVLGEHGGREAMARIEQVQPELFQDDEVRYGSDNRGIEAEAEVTALVKNKLAFETYATVMRMKFGTLRAAIERTKA